MNEAQAWQEFENFLDTQTTEQLIAMFPNMQKQEIYEVGGTLMKRADQGDHEAQNWWLNVGMHHPRLG